MVINIELRLRRVESGAGRDTARKTGRGGPVHAAFNKALRRQTEEALDAWHRTELGGLAMEAANIWRLMDRDVSISVARNCWASTRQPSST